MTTDLENLTFDTLRTVNPGDIVEVSPATDDANHERKHIRVYRVVSGVEVDGHDVGTFRWVDVGRFLRSSFLQIVYHIF